MLLRGQPNSAPPPAPLCAAFSRRSLRRRQLRTSGRTQYSASPLGQRKSVKRWVAQNDRHAAIIRAGTSVPLRRPAAAWPPGAKRQGVRRRHPRGTGSAALIAATFAIGTQSVSRRFASWRRATRRKRPTRRSSRQPSIEERHHECTNQPIRRSGRRGLRRTRGRTRASRTPSGQGRHQLHRDQARRCADAAQRRSDACASHRPEGSAPRSEPPIKRRGARCAWRARQSPRSARAPDRR